jgi:subtilase family serine protease
MKVLRNFQRRMQTAPVCLTSNIRLGLIVAKSAAILPLAILSLLVAPDWLFGENTTIPISSLVARSSFVSPVDQNQQISVVLVLPLTDLSGAENFAQHVSHRGDPLFHHYLTAKEFADKFGGSATDYAVLKEWAVGNGLTVSQESLARTALTVRGTVNQFQSLFRTQINHYRKPSGEEFYSAAVAPTIPTAISGKTAAILGLTGSKMHAPQAKIGKVLGETPTESPNTADSGTGPAGSYTPADLRTVYSIPNFGQLDNTTVVALFEQGGFFKSDIETFLTTMKLPHRPVTFVSVNGYDGTVNDLEVELEAVADIDMTIGINPDVQEVLVYEDGIDPFSVAFVDALTKVADDDKAQVMSISYAQDEGEEGQDAINAENSGLVQLAAEGITVTAASGDKGAYGDGFSYPYNVSDPASQPYVTGVGGTTLFTGAGQQYVSEHVWNDSENAVAASGGGISQFWSFPSFQAEVAPFYITLQGGSLTHRNVPDVCALGDPLTGVAVYSKLNGGWMIVAGTSIASPIWASYLGIVNEAMRYSGLGNIGYFNPLLYDVGSWLSTAAPIKPATVNPNIATGGVGEPDDFLYSIFVGSNGDATLFPGYPGYNAGGTLTSPRYSNATGIGSLFGGGLAAQLLISGSQSGPVPGSITSFTVKTESSSAKFEWSPVTNASAYAVTIVHPGATFEQNQTYVTKKNSLKVKGLIPSDQNYSAILWAYDPSGFSFKIVSFATK